MKFKNLLSIAAFLMLPLLVSAQVSTPQPSPMANFEQKVGLGTVTFEYSRPSAKGRTVFGDLVPYGAYWRTGANAATVIGFTEDAKVGGKDVKAGRYSLFTIPNATTWEVILHSNTSYWGTGGSEYDKAGEVARFEVTPSKSGSFVETFRIDVNDITNKSANIVIEWADTKISFPIEVDTDSKVVSSIEKTMAGPSARDYYSAASYYFAENKDDKKALDWINKAINGGMNQFWVLRQKSLIQARMGNYEGAMITAKQSLDKAKEANNADYIKMNNDSIKEWVKMIK